MAIQTVPNYGLFEGIANGLNQGLLTYQNQKNIQHQRQMEGMMTGIETDDKGNPTGQFAPWKQAQMDNATQAGLLNTQALQQQVTHGGLMNQTDQAKSEEQVNMYNPDSKQTSIAEESAKAYGHVPVDGETAADLQPYLDRMEKKYAADKMAEAAKNKNQGFVQSRVDANQMRANGAYDNIIGKKYEDRLDAANRVKDLISRAQNGSLIPSENLGQQLATDINTLQSGHTSVAGTEGSKPSTLFGKGGQFAHFVSGDPQAAITTGDLGQMAKETDILYNDIGDQHKSKFSSWVKGQPQDVRPFLMDRYNESRRQYFKNEESGSRPASSASGKTADKPPVADASHAIGTRMAAKDGKTYEFSGGDWNDRNNWKPVTSQVADGQ